MERSSGAAPPLGIALRAAGDDTRVIELVGELDLGTIPKLETRLLRTVRSYACVILDLRRLSFIDSSGIALLIEAHRAVPEGGKLLTVISRRSQVERVLEIAGIGMVLSISYDLDGAIAAPAPRPQRSRRAA